MRAAIHLAQLSLKTRLRGMRPSFWVLIGAGALLFPGLNIMLGQAAAGLSTCPLDVLPVTGGYLNILLLVQIGSAFSAAFATLYLSRDLPLLLASPCRPRWVLLAKMLEILASGLIPYLAFGAPLFFGIGLGLHAPIWYYPLVILAGIPFVAIPAVVAVTANIMVSRLVPAYRAKEISGALGVLAGAGAYLVTRLATLATQKVGSLSDFAGFLARLAVSWSPSVVLARAVVEGLYGRPFPLIVVALEMAGAAVMLFSLLTQGAERAYVSGWAAAGTRRSGRGSARGSAGGSAGGSVRGSVRGSAGELRPSATASLGAGRFAVELHSFKVESRLLFRDFESQSQALYAMVMMLGMVLLQRGGAGDLGRTVDSVMPLLYLALGAGSSQWGIRSMPVTVRLLRQAPAHSVRVMRGKALFYGAIQTVFAVVFALTMRLFGRPVPGNRLVLVILWASMAFATGAVSVAAAVYDPGVSEATGVPRLGTAGSVLRLIANLVIFVIACVGYLRGMAKGGAWNHVLLTVAAMAGAFVIAVNAAARMVLSARPRPQAASKGSPLAGGPPGSSITH